jgi:pimeloyl-ACP methyl ester carboxylesterase
MRILTHAKSRLALHELRAGPGPTLLLLHELGLASPTALPEELAAWPGAVAALDFTGHGASTVPRGGGYTSELLMGDADAALDALGSATLLGRGLGAYVALLLAGARPQTVRGAILCDGAGLAGGGARPRDARLATPDASVAEHDGKAPDPFAELELGREIRPPDYAAVFARQARAGSDLPEPLAVCARERPPWLGAVLEIDGVSVATLPDALRAYAPRP